MDKEKGNVQTDEKQKTTASHDKRKQNEYYNSKFQFGNGGSSFIIKNFLNGFTTFLIIAASILFYFALLRLPNISHLVSKVIDVLKPVIYGFAIAYLLNPIVMSVDEAIYPYLNKKLKEEKRAQSYARVLGVIIALAILIIGVSALCNMVLPDLFISIRSLIYTLPVQMNHMLDNLNTYFNSQSTTSNIMREILGQGSEYLQNWMRNDLLSKINEWMGNLTEGMIGFIGEVVNVIIGIIISVYLMFSKETFSKQAKKIVYALFPARQANNILHIANKTNNIFGGFIIGKIIDSVIIGILCFVGLSIINLPYALLISTIVGVTNVIPFFGPYIGAVPSTLLLLVNNPIQAVYFVIFILVLQQVDGNIIGPKILGSSTGLSPFWVIVAILIGGGLFGFVGMLLGVPTFGVIYYLAEVFVEGRLRRKKLPTDKDSYGIMSYVDAKGEYHGEDH